MDQGLALRQGERLFYRFFGVVGVVLAAMSVAT